MTETNFTSCGYECIQSLSEECTAHHHGTNTVVSSPVHSLFLLYVCMYVCVSMCMHVCTGVCMYAWNNAVICDMVKS